MSRKVYLTYITEQQRSIMPHVQRISLRPLCHTHCLHQLTCVLFPLGCHGNHSAHTYTHTLLLKRCSAHDSNASLTQDNCFFIYEHIMDEWHDNKGITDRYIFEPQRAKVTFPCFFNFSLRGAKWFSGYQQPPKHINTCFLVVIASYLFRTLP